MTRQRWTWSALISMAATVAVVATVAMRPQAQATWDQKAAAAYLDERATWWAGWTGAARDHQTFCVSCHTALPYALARPALRTAVGEAGPSPSERALIENVTKRVRLWRDVEPFYPDQTRGLPKTSESRGTEAILNAVILASRDARAGTLSEDARTAFANLWALQLRSGDAAGSWAWLNFRYEPWESAEGAYYGAALVAIAVGTAPDGYAATADIQERVTLLRGYLKRRLDAQPLFGRLVLAWASTRMSGILTPDERRAILDAVASRQQDDGGWSLSSLGAWKRSDGTPLETRSDGYATGLAVLVLEQAGVPPSAREVSNGLTWLAANQDKTRGFWPAWSLNKQRDPASDAGRFMSDAATAFAVLALTQGK